MKNGIWHKTTSIESEQNKERKKGFYGHCNKNVVCATYFESITQTGWGIDILKQHQFGIDHAQSTQSIIPIAIGILKKRIKSCWNEIRAH